MSRWSYGYYARMLILDTQALRGEVDRLQQTVNTLVPTAGGPFVRRGGDDACVVTIRIPGSSEPGAEGQLGSTVAIYINGSGPRALVRE